MNTLSDWLTLVASAGIACLALFQILVAAGRPYGAAAFGGTHTVLPQRLRLASAISSVVFIVALWFVLARRGPFGDAGKSTVVSVVIWVFVAVFGLSALANIGSRSRWERLLMAPLAVVLAACCAAFSLRQ
jgi:hypothetical protein